MNSQYSNKTKLAQAEKMVNVEGETRGVEEIYVSLGGLLLEVDAPKAEKKEKKEEAPKKKESKKDDK